MTDVVQGLALYFAYIAVTMFAGLPLSPATLLVAKVAPPALVALVGALAATIMAVVDYALVRRAARLSWLRRAQEHRYYGRVVQAAKVAPFVTVLLFASVPLPFFIVRVVMPLSGYSLARYATATAIGRGARLFVIASFGGFVDIPTPWLLGLLASGLVMGAAGAASRLVRHRRAMRTADAPTSAP